MDLPTFIADVTSRSVARALFGVAIAIAMACGRSERTSDVSATATMSAGAGAGEGGSASASASADATAGAGESATRRYWTSLTELSQPPVKLPAGVTGLVAHVPEGFDASAPLHLVLYLHGSEMCAKQLALNGDVVCHPGAKKDIGAGLADRIDDAGAMALFALPQFAYMTFGTPGRTRESGYFRAMIEELVERVFAPGLGAKKTLDDVASITLIAHSAGYIPLWNILDHGGIDDKVRNVVLVDAMFAGGVDVYARWLERGNADAPRRFVSVHGGWGASVPNAMAMAARAKSSKRGLAVAIDPPGSLTEAVRANDVVVARRDIEHAWMILLFPGKIVAGLGLPPRALSPSRDPVPDAPAPPPKPIVDHADGSLDWGHRLMKNGAVADEYVTTLRAQERVTITTRGGPSLTEWGNLDVYTELVSDGRVVAFDDDGAGKFDSRIAFTPPTTGEYVVRVSTFGQGIRRGPYRVTIER